jgi:NSS family neurotransmitter:Na+ symporter
MMIDNIITNIQENYSGYETGFVIGWGWVVAILAIVVGFLLTLKPWDKATEDAFEKEASE